MPDALNPVEWYKGARDVITDSMKGKKDSDGQTLKQKPGPNDGSKFPNLSSEPDRPKKLSLDQKLVCVVIERLMVWRHNRLKWILFYKLSQQKKARFKKF